MVLMNRKNMFHTISSAIFICFLAIFSTWSNVVHSFQLQIAPSLQKTTALLLKTQSRLDAQEKDDDACQNQSTNLDRRAVFEKTGNLLKVSVALSSSMMSSSPQLANASTTPKSRSEGYEVQYTEREWAYMLSGKQYNILREGGTERPYSSILEGEEREGQYVCAGCNTALFESTAKFHSGTGWPSYASGLPGVETQQVSAVQASLLGAEIRCGTCGGHLGDVFNDGFVYVGTPAFETGKRFCVDGAALIFKPKDGSEDVFGDLPPSQKKNELPDFLQPPKIMARDV